MARFWKQLVLLLWKNFCIRKRQMFRNFWELLWPLAIFIILVAVRTRSANLPKNIPTKKGPIYFSPRALPSAGALPFVQSLFCNYKVNTFIDTPQELPTFTNTIFSEIAKDLAPVLTNESSIDKLRSLSSNFSSLFNDIRGIIGDIDTIDFQISQLFGNKSQAKNLLMKAGLNAPVAEDLANTKIRILNLINLINVRNSSNTSDIFMNVKNNICSGSALSSIFDFPATVDKNEVKKDLCNRSLSSFVSIGVNIYSDIYLRRDAIWNKLRSISTIKGTIALVNKTVIEFQTILTEVRSMEYVQNVFDDLRKFFQNLSSLRYLTVKDFFCGKTTVAKKISNSTKSTPKKPVTKPTTKPTAKPTKKTTVTWPLHGGGSDAKCNKIYPKNRTDCGWGYITENQCLELKCCYDSTVDHTKYCFCPTNNKSSCCHKRRKLFDALEALSGSSKQMVDFLTIILKGKVLYTPDNAKTREVIRKISVFVNIFTGAVKYVKQLRSITQSFVNIAEKFVRNKEQLKQIESVVNLLRNSTLSALVPQVKEIQEFMKRYARYINSSYITEGRIQSVKILSNTMVSYMTDVESAFECYNLSAMFKPFATEKDMVNYAIKNASSTFLSSIVFLNLNDQEPYPKNIKYKLRFNPDYTPSTSKIKAKYWKPGPGPRGRSDLYTYQYITFGFVFLQDLIDRALIETVTNRTVFEPGLYIQQFPYPCYIKDNFITGLGNMMPLFMVIAWVYTVAMIVKSIVYEKELRLKEVMKVMGLDNSVHWAAWFITSFLTMFVTIIVLVLLLKFGKILIYSDISLVIFVLSIFGCATIALSFLISVFFAKANISAACGGIIYFFTYLPYPLTLWFEEQMTFNEKGAVSLLSTTAFGMAFKYITRWEEQGIGAQWSNFYNNPMPTDTYSVGWAVNFLIIDICLYLILMWYFENVLPGQYGMPKKWYFPFTWAYWTKKTSKIYVGTGAYRIDEQRAMERNEEFAEMQPTSDFQGKFEKDPTDVNVGVHIQNLVKIYRHGHKPAIDGLNLKLFEDQVMSLLGHNGAGKSTTMSILTGLFPPTSGTAVVYGDDIRTNIKGVRKNLGLCPQHNVLFNDMTVEEHMWFYGGLKGMSKNELAQEIEKFLTDVGLPEKRNEMSQNLSGGMKRKLSVAMAFIAKSKTVILDEPTSGVDPYSRRSIWDLILQYKTGRTILLSTHYMDEADLLGDRVSIISNGRLQCSGTPLFLKRRFGKGYFLTITKDDDNSAQFSRIELTNFITSFIPGAKLLEDLGGKIVFVLPSAARLTGEFSNLFQNLEDGLKSLGIRNYSISDTTLEEVFLSACNDDAVDLGGEDTVSLTGPAQSRRIAPDNISLHSVGSQTELINNSESYDDINDICTQRLSSGPLLWFQQFKAIMIKRFHHARRSRKGFFSQILLPAIFVITAMCVSLIRPPATTYPSLELSLKMFGKPSYVIMDNINVNAFSEKLISSFLKAPGLGTACVKPSKCANKSISSFLHDKNMTAHKPKKDTSCYCSSGKQQCSSTGPEPNKRIVSTGETVFDLTGKDMNGYILKTTDNFVRMRYGGATFGHELYNFKDWNSSNINASNLASGFPVRRNAKVWFNNKGYHALPTFVNIMNNAILRSNLNGLQDPTEYGITTYNHPMDFNREQIEDVVQRQGITDLFVAIFVILALAFVPASFLVYLVQDRVSKSKHLQLVSGLNPFVYWTANYIWDLVNYMIPAVCCIVIFLAFDQKAYVSKENFPATFILLFLYGWSMIPMIYPASFFFDVPSTAYIVLICVNLFIGVIGTLATFILEFIGKGDKGLEEINDVLKKVLLIFPNYCLGRGLMDLAQNQLVSEVYRRFGPTKLTNPFEWSIIGRNIAAMILCGLFYMILTMLFQYRFFLKPWRSIVNPNPKINEEQDVSNERDRILEEELGGKEFILKTDNLTKLYKKPFHNRKTLAVDRLTFGIKEGECFGLLGVNGAGKTSTFKMLTGDTSITAGDAFVKGYSVHKDMNIAHHYMGYCPQFDALDELLTGKELLTYYSQIRGMSRKEGEKMANWAIETLGLTPYKEKICGDYSGGNKRKLSTAIALLGSPPLIFLDEPTTGMDPGARRFLWNVVLNLLKMGKSIVLTSHSMEECETLCTRLGIMVNGVFKCLGSPQHLRNKFGMGYTVIIRSKINFVSTVQDFVSANFVNAKLKDRHHNMLEYQIPTNNLLLSQVFHKLELLRKTSSIEDYSVTQTTLDQIFVNFARAQVEEVQFTGDLSEERTQNLMLPMDNWSSENVVHV